MKKIIGIIGLSLVIGFAGCAGQTHEEKGTKNGALIGAGAGALLGQVIGRNTQGTVLGAAAGAAVGGLVGNRVGSYMDKQEEELKKAAAESESLTVKRTQDALVATFKADLLFDRGSANLKSGAYPEMDRIAGILSKYPATRLKVEGHTDSTGSESFNQKLSEKRAESVKSALVQRSVAPERIATVGYGASMPVAPDAAQNRRVSIVIMPAAQG